MAIQNFLSGGYYGKLGETVGQRWKNKRTIRSYVIPNNPRTEKQQANRGLFANAVTYAQMGLQMNYYATCFESEEFTHWNYRMRVARQLREKGLSGLDLIPLYPISFTPPILISALEVKDIEDNKHVTLLCPVLQGEIERVFSVMFDIFDENGQELGLKLYLGHYSPTEKGILKIDVDDAAEINNYLKVRVISNDDVDSNTDLIASPTIGIKRKQIEIKDFDTSILSFTKDQTGITVIFNEKWRDDVTINTISGSVSYVSNGAKVSDIFSADALRNIDGQCALFVPVATSTSQALPAFPNGCGIIITDVQYSGAFFQYTKQNAEEPLVDADLQRTLNAPTKTSANYGVTLLFNFGYTGTETSAGAGKILSHYWLTDNVEETCSYLFKKNSDGKLELYANQDGKTLPMWSGDYITTPEFSFVQNGVTYKYGALTQYPFTNNITERSWLTVRDFDTSIKSFSKSSSDIVVVFNEVWKSDAKVNSISANVSFVSNGAKTSKSVSGVALVNNGGYCSVSIPYATSDNQALPAFPSGSQIVVSALELSSKAYSLTSSNVTKSLVDTDLTRTLNAPTKTSANYGVTLEFDFNYTGVDTAIGFGNVLSHYYLGNDIEAEYTFKIKKNSNNKLEFFADTQGFMLPMFGNDYISTPAISFVQNGVTYIYSPLTGETFENSIRETTWTESIFNLAESVIVNWGAEDASDAGNVLIPLNNDLLPNELFDELVTITKSGSYFELNTDSGQDWGAPSSFNGCDLYLTRDDANLPCYLRFEFYISHSAEEVIASCILYENAFKFVYNGVTYKSPSVAKSFDNIVNNPY